MASRRTKLQRQRALTAARARRRSLKRAKPGTQLSLGLPKPNNRWGGARRNAGRKPVGARAGTPHRARPKHDERHPVHVTLRAGLASLRSQLLFPTVRYAITKAGQRDVDRFRIVHFSAQHDHVHLIVEAANKRALGAGMRSLAIRVARQVNRLLMRKGRFWADRWHGRALASPSDVRNAVVYVLANFRKHARRPAATGIDPCSSGAWFAHFRGFDPEHDRPRYAARPPPLGAADLGVPVSPPRTWLLTTGLARTPRIGMDEAPFGVVSRHERSRRSTTHA
jgi:REP element-mobilizing transposase RayT